MACLPSIIQFRLEEKLIKLNKLRPLPKSVVQKLREKFQNGRTARLTMNLLLMQAEYPLVIILKNDRKKYYDVLDKADSGQYEPLVKFIAQSTERSLDIYLKTLTPAKQKQERFTTLAGISKTTPFSAKYLNLLARQGKLEAYKEGRNWLISKETIERYLKNRIRQRKISNL